MLQQHVITWLAGLPIVLAALRAVTIGDRFFTAAVAGRRGGEGAAQASAVLAGLSFLGLVFFALGGQSERNSVAVALVLLAFGGFVLSFYLLSGFRELLWQRWLAAALQEAAVFWLVLGIARWLVDGGFAASGTESQAAIWLVVVIASVALIMGTLGRMARDVR